jgi:aminomethyltransferase
MPVPTPFHARTAPLCKSYRWKDWAGYCTVCSYETAIEPEYLALRHAAGLIDVSPLYKYDVAGRDAAALLSYVATRDLCGVAAGRVVYACWCDADGKVIDDGTIARLDAERFRVTAASPAGWWLQRCARGFDASVRDDSEAIAALALQGPMSGELLQRTTNLDVAGLRYFRVAAAQLGGVPVEITRTGYTGDLGYEIWVARERALAVWDALFAAGSDYGLRPVGLDALDIVRLEAGYILQDVDYFSAPRCAIDSRKSSPFEIGLGWCVQLEREPFVGQSALAAEKSRGSPWALVGLEIDWPALERLYDAHRLPPHLPVRAWRDAVPVFAGRRQVGQATSGTWSPTAKKNIALASVASRHAAAGTELHIEHTVEYRRATLPARVVARPFLDLARKRT